MCSNPVKAEPVSPARDVGEEVEPCQLLFTQHMCVTVKVETDVVAGGEWRGNREGASGTSPCRSETERAAGPETEVHIKEEPESDSPVRVKEEPSWPNSEACGGSEAGMLADLDAEHEVTIEIELRQERPRRSVLPLQASAAATTSRPEGSAPAYQCHHCSKRFRNNSVLKKHMHTHSSGPNSTGEKDVRCQMLQMDHKCSFCDYKNDRMSSIRTHERTHTGEKPFRCDHCEYSCSRKSYMRSHMRTHTDEKPFHCSDCDFKCRFKSGLISHEWIHKGEKQYKCEHNDCDYATTTKRQLRAHQMIHTGEMPFQCSSCDLKCRTNLSLRRHEYRVHSSEKRFECNKCEFKGKRKEDLRNHQLTHTGKKLFNCNYCDYKFTQKSNLRVHEMRHTGEKPFQCGECEYKCKSNRDLRKHLRIHTRGKNRLVATTATTSAGNNKHA